MLHGLFRQPGAAFESRVGRGIEICPGYRIEENLKAYLGTSALLAEQRYCSGDIAASAIADNSDPGSIDGERSRIFRDIFRGGICFLNRGGESARGGSTEFDDRDGCTNADSKLASETIMGGRVSQGPSTSVEEHHHRRGLLELRRAQGTQI